MFFFRARDMQKLVAEHLPGARHGRGEDQRSGSHTGRDERSEKRLSHPAEYLHRSRCHGEGLPASPSFPAIRLERRRQLGSPPGSSAKKTIRATRSTTAPSPSSRRTTSCACSARRRRSSPSSASRPRGRRHRRCRPRYAARTRSRRAPRHRSAQSAANRPSLTAQAMLACWVGRSADFLAPAVAHVLRSYQATTSRMVSVRRTEGHAEIALRLVRGDAVVEKEHLHALERIAGVPCASFAQSSEPCARASATGAGIPKRSRGRPDASARASRTSRSVRNSPPTM